MSGQVWFPDTAIATGLYGLVIGMLVPAIIARIPEPEPEDGLPTDQKGALRRSGEERPGQDTGQEPGPAPLAPVKERYSDMAKVRGLAPLASLTTAVVAALLGARLGWTPALSFLLYLAPVGVALGVVDWRTRLLPTKLIAPSYLVVAALVLVSAWLDGSWHHLAGAGWGWLVAGGTYFVLWFVYPRGMGYGDVRLAGLLGIALGYLGWSELLTGVYAGFLLGGVGGLLLTLTGIVDRKSCPFGPFMLVGAVVGVVAGPFVAAFYA
jgi:leader peptidase (prepilin peptidase) / N-methyltransferase